MSGSMRVGIYQPQYFPRLHYVNRALDSDVFVLLESAQYVKRLTHPGEQGRHPSFQADAPVRLPDGPHNLTVPVAKRPSYAPINKKEIDYSQGWQRVHLATLELGYQKAPFYEPVTADVERIVGTEWPTLADLNRRTFLWALARVLDLDLGVDDIDVDRFNAALAAQPGHARLRRVVTDTELATSRPQGRQQGAEWTAAICAELGADEYIHGGTAQHGYMDDEPYTRRGVATVLQDWRCEPYPQMHAGKGPFLANLSVVDLICNVDASTARDVLMPDRPSP